MGNLIDLAGQEFGRLKILRRAGKDKRGEILWLCQCNCGNLTTVRGSILRNGRTVSCGCLIKEMLANGTVRRTHGMGKTSTYRIYYHMLDRCNNTNNPFFDRYGGRGINICPDWTGKNGFVNFLRNMGERPQGKSIDRIDNDGNYEPGNCRWATPKEQARNRKGNRLIEYNGKIQCLKALAEELGITRSAMRYSLQKHSFAEAVKI